MKYALLLIGFIYVVGCSPATQPSTSNKGYEEDLSSTRPQVPVQAEAPVVDNTEIVSSEEYVAPTEHLKAEIDSVMRIKAARNEEVGYLQGFTIQVYTGRSRDRANNAKNAVYELLVDQEATVYYDQPMFRVKVGQYYTRLEAEKSFNLLKDTFPQALVLPERIPLEE